MTTLLQARDLTLRFDGQKSPALDSVNVEVTAGSFTVVVGPSGCGKTTLLGCFAGLLDATSGDVAEDGMPINGPAPSRGVVFQRDVLFPWASVWSNLEFALRATGVPKRERKARVASLLDAVHLPAEVAHSKPRHLSGGMRQRVGIARMLAGEPRVMLMDEPFGALDAQTRLRMQDLVTEIWTASRRTVVFITHDVDEAIRLADRIVVLGEGQVRAVIDNVLPRPRPAERLADLPGYSDLRRDLFDLLHPVPGSSDVTARTEAHQQTQQEKP